MSKSGWKKKIEKEIETKRLNWRYKSVTYDEEEFSIFSSHQNKDKIYMI